MKNHPGEDLCFVSANTKDFGDGSSYVSPMSEDIDGLRERLTHLTSFDSVVSNFSQPIEIDEEYIEGVLVELLTSQEALAVLENAAEKILTSKGGSWPGNEIQGFIEGIGPAQAYPSVGWTSWLTAPTAVLRRVSGASGHEIGEEKWYTATVDWILVGLATRSIVTLTSASTGPGFSRTACQWRTKLLFSTKEGEAPTLLKYWSAEALDLSEREQWEPLLQKSTAPALSSRPFELLATALFTIAASQYRADKPSGAAGDPSDD